MTKMTLGSLFDGSGGFPLAGILNGIEPKWLAEIEPFPCRVTAARFPRIPNHGDVTKIDGAKIEPVDIITFGSPCQDLSVAGKQKGIHDGERSNLFFEAVRIIKEMRNATTNEFPRFAVWENVPGAFSSNGGEDFRSVLEAFCGVANREGVTIPFPQDGKWKPAGCIVGDGFSIAWHQYDAQFWGVAQRRKRIYLIADFGSERAGEILFKSDCMRGDFAEGGEAWEGTTADAEGSAGGSDQVKCLNPWDPEGKRIFRTDGAMQTLFAGEGGHLRGVCYSIEGNVCDRDAKQNGMGISEDVCPSLNTQDRHVVAFMGGQGAKARSIAYCDDGTTPTLRAAPSGGNTVPDVCYAVDCQNLQMHPEISGTLQAKNQGGHSLNYQNHVVYPDKARSLCARHDSSPCLDRGQNVVIYDTRGNGDGEKVPTLTGDHENRIMDYTALATYIQPSFGEFHQSEFATTLKASDGRRVDPGAVVLEHGRPPRKYIVRRLTPIECARLQGFPDWWTDGVEGSDSARYKMWGNGIALPCAADVLGRIAKEG